MALTRSLTNLTADVRKLCDVQGTSGTQRHPDADITEYLNRAVGSYHRLLTSAVPDARFLASATVTTSSGTSSYTLTSSFSVTDLDSLFSVEIDAEGVKRWLTAWDPHEHAHLSDTNLISNGIPTTYRLQADNMVLLPTPGGAYTVTIWYITTPTMLSAGGDTIDTISRLDEYVTCYAAQFIAAKDRQWDLYDRMGARVGALAAEVAEVGRSRDRNSPARVVDEDLSDRFGRPMHRSRR